MRIPDIFRHLAKSIAMWRIHSASPSRGMPVIRATKKAWMPPWAASHHCQLRVRPQPGHFSQAILSPWSPKSPTQWPIASNRKRLKAAEKSRRSWPGHLNHIRRSQFIAAVWVPGWRSRGIRSARGQNGCFRMAMGRAAQAAVTKANAPREDHSSSSEEPAGIRRICLRPSLISNSSPGARSSMAV